MFSHIVLGANDTEASKKFYDAILNCLGYEAGNQLESGRTLYNYGKGVFLHLPNHWMGPLQIVVMEVQLVLVPRALLLLTRGMQQV